METVELRLLRCYLGGTKESNEASVKGDTADNEAISTSAASMDDGITDLLVQVERGLYAEALSSTWLSVVVGKVPTFDPSTAKDGGGAEEFYKFVESRVLAFLSSEGVSGSPEEENRQHRGLLVLALGVAVLSAFLQANMTGPIQEQFVSFPGHVVLNSDEASAGFDEQEWDAWARRQLMVDGCDILGKISLPQYLILAKLLLLNPAVPVVDREDSGTRGPKSRSWWAFRVLLIQQRILAERSASLRVRLVSSSLDFIKYFDTVKSVQLLGWKIHKQEAQCMVAAAHLEIGLMEHVYGHDDAARKCFSHAAESCGMEVALTGALGFRTQYQADPKAQMVLIASTDRSSLDEDTNWLDFLDPSAENLQNIPGDTEQSEILLAPRLLDATNEESHVENGKPPGGDQKILKSIEQAIVLAMAIDVKKSNPDDEFRSWQMAPFIEAVDIQHISHPMVKAWCQLLRVRWEKTRARTRERSFLMMEKLATDVRETSVKVSQRMSYVFCVPFPIVSGLLKEYAEVMVGSGLVGDAMKLFEELELWNNLIDCYCLIGKKTAAAGLIRQRLQVQPNEPRLWCSLGDVVMDDDYYQKAWEVSGHSFTRAQRSLARTAFNKGNYTESIYHWDLALSLNPLHPDGWFALGSAALKARDVDKALVAFSRQVQLDPENGESWNNIAAVKMQQKRSNEAFVAFREALKFKRNSWQIWANFGQVALDVANFGQAVLAVEKVLDLSDEKRVELPILTRLVEELETRKGLVERPMSGPETPNGGETESEELDNGYENDDDTWSSLRMDLPLIASISEGQVAVEEAVDMIPEMGSISAQTNETELMLQKVGKLLSRIVVKGSGGGEIWGLKARWHKLVGDAAMSVEALLKQVRAYQGSKWQHNSEEFQVFSQACLQLCTAYMQFDSTSSAGKRGLFSAQMLLRNTIKQVEHFNNEQPYTDMVLCLDRVERAIQEVPTKVE